MPRSSRHKSHKQSKHSSKEAKEYYSESDEDAVAVRMKEKEKEKEMEKERKEEGSCGGSVRVSRDSGEKRKLSSSALLREGKVGKDLNGNGNGDALEEHVSLKRRKGGDCGRRDDGGASESLRNVDSERSVKFNKESEGLGESRSKSSKRQEGGGEKEEKFFVLVEKEERSGGGSGRTESKRKSEGRKEGKEKEKDRGPEREKKGQESKREDTVLVKKQGSQWDDVVEEKHSKKGREINGKVTSLCGGFCKFILASFCVLFAW